MLELFFSVLQSLAVSRKSFIRISIWWLTDVAWGTKKKEKRKSPRLYNSATTWPEQDTSSITCLEHIQTVLEMCRPWTQIGVLLILFTLTAYSKYIIK